MVSRAINRRIEGHQFDTTMVYPDTEYPFKFPIQRQAGLLTGVPLRATDECRYSTTIFYDFRFFARLTSFF